MKGILTPDRKRGVFAGRVLMVFALLFAIVVGLLSGQLPFTKAPTTPSQLGYSAPDTPPVPKPPIVAAGAANQKPFELLGITGIGQQGPVTFPSSVTPSSAGSAMSAFAGARGAGLWISVQGGIGYRTIRMPMDTGEHSFTFGNETLTMKAGTNSLSYSWIHTGGGIADIPYQFGALKASNGQRQIALIPTDLTKQYQVTAQPLSSTGKALGRLVSLSCQPVNTSTFFVQIPAGYDSFTRQMQVTAIALGSNGDKASWRLTGLPQSVHSGDAAFTPVVAAKAGPLALRAVAVESEDQSGITTGVNQHPLQKVDGDWLLAPPPNADEHGWTGVPTIHVLLHASNSSTDVQGQDWRVKLTRVTPEWQTAPSSPTSNQILTLSEYSVQNAQPDKHSGIDEAWEAGVAYPAQQHWIRIDGEMIHFVNIFETVTFHDAEVIQDGTSGKKRLVWCTPETSSTPSGFSFSVLNQRDGRGDLLLTPPGGGMGSPGAFGMLASPGYRMGSSSSSANPSVDNGDVPVLLAWRMPRRFASSTSVQDAPYQVGVPELVGTPRIATYGYTPYLNPQRLEVPGQTDARSVLHDGYSGLYLPLPASVNPQTVPGHIKSITVRLPIRELKEIRPFHLVVPVRSSLPAGWDPEASQGRMRASVNGNSSGAMIGSIWQGS